jgi:hypothetical protein
MPEFVTLSCPSCGGQLKITPDIDRFACAYCGQEHVVRRGDGTIALAPILESFRKVEAATDKTAAELAIVRLQKRIEQLEGSKEELLKEDPFPKGENARATALFLAAIVGLILTGLALVFTGGKSSVPIYCFLGSAAVGALGFASWWGRRRDEKAWHTIVGEDLHSLNERIQAAEAELERYEEIVAAR